MIPGEAVAIANIGDYAAMRLTGRKQPLTDESIAASFGGFSLKEGCFERDRLRMAGVAAEYYPLLSGEKEAAGLYRGNSGKLCFWGIIRQAFTARWTGRRSR